jgi:hypothetical protein
MDGQLAISQTISESRVDRSIRRAPYRSSSLATRLLSEDLVTAARALRR